MKKQTLIIISIVIVLAITASCVYFFKQNNSKNKNPQAWNQNANVEEASIDSLAAGNWVSVMAEKNGDTYSASMIAVCESKELCQNDVSKRTGKQRPDTQSGAPSGVPSGDIPSKNPSSGGVPSGEKRAQNATMLSGTIAEVGADSVSIVLDSGETVKVSITDSTRIIKR